MNISRQEFLTEIPRLYPATDEHINFWRRERRRCIEGYWVSGYWMPGKLYFYVNYSTIKLNVQSAKVKSLGRPWLRDIEWKFFRLLEIARGFSGFEGDHHFSCHEALLREDLTDEEIITEYCLDEETGEVVPEKFNNIFLGEALDKKKYVDPKEYVEQQHSFDKGRPLYNNQSKNIMMIGARGFGKSYMIASIMSHEFLFDGLTRYTSQKETKTSSQVVAGAGDAKYSSDTLSKTRLMLENLPGDIEINGRHFPSPFVKRYTGSWYPGKKIIASYKKKIGGNWKHVGTKSSILHRTFKDNPFAANGTRPGIMTFEEVGMFDNLKESYVASVECQRNGSDKFGTMIFIGTGGDMVGGGTRDAYEIFYNPHAYDCIALDDIWEHRGKIGYFVPAYLGLNQYKDSNGFTNEAPAKRYLELHRRKLLDAGSSTALDGELINRPIKPSEIFLLKHGNIFPIHELQERLSNIEQPDTQKYLQTPVHLYFDERAKSGVNYKIDTKRKLRPINDFPYDGDNRDGAVVIYEFPIKDEKTGVVPSDMYIIGHDPYSSDDPSGNSLASIYVLKTKKYLKHGHDEIVASFVGRPYHGRNIVNEHLLKLSMFYGNATIYFENATGNTKEYFEKHKKLHLLAKQPQTVLTKKAAYDGRAPNIYGYPMNSRQMKNQAIQYLRDWLLEERGMNDSGKIIRNLDRIPDKALLQELIAFNMEGNFDRVMGFAGCIIGLEETHNQHVNELETESQIDHAINFFSSNRLFKTKKYAKQF